ncbi:MFS transporter [Longispora fulva]|uniref:MFS family permease n=1 Tax=Longispora fulva TaxID=619741 RepID=A0A8J7GBV5_9ACTN|nr:MFS transporter [Longispora fulva]MBG6134666.1 MFS family permease [Longispora fulva]
MVTRILPPAGLARSLALQSALIAVGSGTFLTGSVVFFTHVVGLSPVQIGVGFSLVGFVGLVGSLPLGHLADRLGGKRAWVIGAVAEAACFACYPLARGFWSFLAVLLAASVADLLAGAGRHVYVAAALPQESRVRSMAFMRAYLNIGFTVGAGLGAVALAFDSTAALVAMVLINAVGLLVNALVVSRMPRVTVPAATREARPFGVLTDRPYLALSTVFAVIWWHGLIFTEVLPLWAITHTDAPKPALGALFALNTVMAVLLQVPATRTADTIAGSTRLLRWAGLATAVACPVLALSGRTHGWVTVAVLALAVVLTTATELWASAAQWLFTTEIPPADQRGAYSGAARTVGSVGRMVGPAALTFLAIQTGGWGWWVIAGVFVGAAAVTGPVLGWVTRTPRNGQPVPESTFATTG